MRNISTQGSALYCVWVSVRIDRGDRLVAIWIDQAVTGFKPRAPETSEGIGTAVTHLVGHKEEDVETSAKKHLASILPRRG